MGVKINTKSIIYKEIVLNNKEEPIGKLKSAAFSPKFNKVVGLMIENFINTPKV